MPVHFWAKTTSDNLPGIAVYEHMLNVGLVASVLAHSMPGLLRSLQISPETAGALTALHDLGKISPGFQQKCSAWLDSNHLTDIARRFMWYRDMESDHGQVTHAVVQEFLVRNGTNRRGAKYVSAILGGHHGRLKPPNDRGFRPEKGISEQHSGIDWDKEREEAARAICDAFGADLQKLAADQETPALWWLAGLISVADWIGSDERFFSAERGVTHTDSAANARQAVTQIGLVPPSVKLGLSFHDLFHDDERPEVQFVPNDMQSRSVSTITAPGVYVIEAPMGAGKTEAALWAAYHLLADRKARGIYFALPTQATSNRMHLRMADFVRRIATTASESKLIHGNSWLLEQDVGILPASSGQRMAGEDARVGRDWFASSKRALLAPFGVGTVDQALLGVVAAKHFFVRHFALAGKVVILDEVHSYDLYTGTLIDKLITILERLDCTIIVLSATLTKKRRCQIVAGAGDDHSETQLAYPVITGRRQEQNLSPVPAIPPVPRKVEVAFRHCDDAAREAIELAEGGGCVLWICNTVAAAQHHYRQLRHACGERFPLGLLHSRFPFWRREQLEHEWMERLGKNGTTRCGSILVSTQIVEQSVDLDADLLVTELAPTDMILQRIGRLWRHERCRRPKAAPHLVILEEAASLEGFHMMNKSAIVDKLGSKARVYDPYVLLCSLRVWNARRQVELPGEIRRLIEATYEERDDEPEPWIELLCDGLGKSAAYRQKALQSSNIWTVALEDDEGVQTRLNEIPTSSLVLCNRLTMTEAEFLDNSQGDLQGDDFRLATAQAVHRNVVRVPDHYVTSRKKHPGFSRYVRGPLCVGVVGADGVVNAEGLRDDLRLRWSLDLGIVIETSASEMPL